MSNTSPFGLPLQYLPALTQALPCAVQPQYQFGTISYRVEQEMKRRGWQHDLLGVDTHLGMAFLQKDAWSLDYERKEPVVMMWARELVQ